MAENTRDEWVLDVVDDIEMPGWVFVPEGLTAQEQATWTDEITGALLDALDTTGWDGQDISEADVRQVLAAALEERASSPSLAMFQVWPLPAAAAVMCHISVHPSDDLPDWTTLEDVVVHAVAAPHIGPGLQCTVRVRERGAGGEEFELVSVHQIFDDGDLTLVLSLDEAPALLMAPALPGLLALAGVVRMHRGDGTPFVSVAPPSIPDESPWQLEDAP